jgi:uncharacterized protein (DUF2147 family)
MQSARRVIAVGICLNLLPWLSIGSAAAPMSGTEPGVRGYWQEPSGAVIEVAPCGEGLCLRIVALSPGEHPHTDVHNPDAKLRSRPLCGLRIGQDFTQFDPQHAAGGHLYDPRSGQTYSGSMTAQGNKLKLRGYLGIPLLGRTETWTRVGPRQASCTAT